MDGPKNSVFVFYIVIFEKISFLYPFLSFIPFILICKSIMPSFNMFKPKPSCGYVVNYFSLLNRPVCPSVKVEYKVLMQTGIYYRCIRTF